MNELKALYPNCKKEQLFKRKDTNDVQREKHMATTNTIQFEKIKDVILSEIINKEYKASCLEIAKVIDRFNDPNEISQLVQIKIKVMLKIISRKITKYDNELALIVDKGIILNIQKWFIEIELDIDRLIYLDQSNKNNIQSIIASYLEMMYVKALLYKQLSHIYKVAALLGISISLIDQTINIITDPYTIAIIQKIYLLVMQLSMSNHDYNNALLYQKKLIDYCFRELLFRVDFYHGLDEGINKKKNTKAYQRIFQTISYALCLRGICKESIGKVTKAIEAYKQSKWFNMKLLNETNPTFPRLIMSFIRRAGIYKEIIYRLKHIEVEEYYVTPEPTISSIIPNKFKSRIAFGNYANMAKYNKAEKIILELKPEEIDIPSPPNLKKANNHHQQQQSTSIEKSNSDIMLSSIRLLDTYRHHKFQNTLHSMNNINIAYFDIDAKEKLQKAIKNMNQTNNNYCYNQNQSKVIDDSNASSPLIKHKSQQSTMMSYYSSPKTTATLFKREDSSMMTDNNDSNLKKTHTISNKLLSNKNKKRMNQLEKYDSNINLFSKSFKKKKMYLDKLDDREYDFQKKILKLRTKEKYHLQIKGKNDTEAEAYFNFNRIKQSQSSKQVKVQPNLTLKEYKELQTQNNLENTVIKSLNTKKYTEFNNKTIEIRSKAKMVNDSNSLGIEDDYTDTLKVNQKNKKVMESLSSNLEILDYNASHSSTLQSVNAKKKKRKNNSAYRSMSNIVFIAKEKKEFDLERFIKIDNI